ncbi:two-component system response regulator YesN [Muricomes intestini]|uniref:Stage 0 sporulation protein A homolog n=1 Tax=Muricomes intestini TaxID=1796634 RepID=A0A4R3K5Z0_9FIRM|nr:response regulator [Muricomes intestini]TCS78091.1 two-component system response regulator YesN [Muricomes intestini]
MKVLIADDEEKICQLIKNLVNWEELDMDVIACVNDGIAALDIIEHDKPDLVITDIRMPGYDGLELIKRTKTISPETEFIIISGYRHFEYAQNAIRYGVKNYLLKPVKKIELNEELEKIHNNYYLRIQKDEDNFKTSLVIKQNKEKIRCGFLENILLKNQLKQGPMERTEINEKYHFNFQEGRYQIIIVKIDGLKLSDKKEIEYIHDKLNRLITKTVGKICLETGYVWSDNFCYVLLNYRQEKSKEVRHAVRNLLDSLLLQKDILRNLFITIGLGEVTNALEGMFHSSNSARRAVEQRLFKGTNRLIEGVGTKNSRIPYTRMFREFNKKFVRGIESLNESELSASITELYHRMAESEEMTGYEVLQMAKEVMTLFLFTIKNHDMTEQPDEDYYDRFTRNLENQGSLSEVMQFLKEQVMKLFSEYVFTCMNEENRPIREAKRYIRENYQKSISLDIVGAQVGFNAAYLSTLFKREAGYTFSEYLTQVRMERAKELLKETDDNVAVVCENVGYNDLKNFTKNFRIYTGLRPNEYRKIYS